MGETKQVQKALIEKTQVELYKKEILYHKFRMEIHNKYSEWKERIFEKEWIRCLKSNGLWFYNTQTELLIPVLPRYNTEHESYGGLRCCNISEEEAVLMFCKHCLRYSMGWCPSWHKVRSPYREPYYLVSSDNRRFRLEFDCKNCQMKVYAEK